jgi:phosphoribosylamine--glycine ligase
MTKQNVLVIGSGGREHAIAWKLAQSPKIGNLYVAPGNGGTGYLAQNVPIPAKDIAGLVDFAKAHEIDVTVVGPDDILAAGCVDQFEAAGLRVFGPTRAAAQIEASKAFSKDLMAKAGVPTAGYATFTNIDAAKSYIRRQGFPLVVKASGLALGKGVYVCSNLSEALSALDDIMGSKVFGDAGNSVVIEEFLQGQEVSIHAFCDGATTVIFPTAQDHKRIRTGDLGPNTGGMGTYAPVPWARPKLLEQVRIEVVEPILTAMAEDGRPFKGLLYPGLMVAPDGSFKVLEFNARFGDPETQSYLRLLATDLLDIINACIDGTLSQLNVEWSNQTAITVVMASEGYPEKAITGRKVSGVDGHSLQRLRTGDWRMLIDELEGLDGL